MVQSIHCTSRPFARKFTNNCHRCRGVFLVCLLGKCFGFSLEISPLPCRIPTWQSVLGILGDRPSWRLPELNCSGPPEVHLISTCQALILQTTCNKQTIQTLALRLRSLDQPGLMLKWRSMLSMLRNKLSINGRSRSEDCPDSRVKRVKVAALTPTLAIH